MQVDPFLRATPPVAPTSPGLLVDARGDGTFAVAAPRAEAIDLCVREGRTERRQRLRHVDGGLHWDHVRGMVPGTRYGIRAHGPWNPAEGLFFHPGQLLVDPYTRGLSHASPLLSSFFPFPVDSMLDPRDGLGARRTEDNAADAIWSEVVSDAFDWQGDLRPMTDWDATVMYELHVKGYTQQNPAVPVPQRGTYAGLAHPAVTTALRELGVTTVELLPVQAAMDEAHLARRGLVNYWATRRWPTSPPSPPWPPPPPRRPVPRRCSTR